MLTSVDFAHARPIMLQHSTSIFIGASVSEPPLVDSTDALSRYIYIYIYIQCSVRREGTGHYFSFQPFSRPLSMLSPHNTYQNDPQGIPINVIIMISHHVTVR